MGKYKKEKRINQREKVSHKEEKIERIKKKKKGSEFAPAELVGQYMLVRTHSTILRYLCLFILYVAEHSPAPKMMETV